jgi:hypothetical protein
MFLRRPHSIKASCEVGHPDCLARFKVWRPPKLIWCRLVKGEREKRGKIGGNMLLLPSLPSPVPLTGMASPVPVVALDLQGTTNMILEYQNNVIRIQIIAFLF